MAEPTFAELKPASVLNELHKMRDGSSDGLGSAAVARYATQFSLLASRFLILASRFLVLALWLSDNSEKKSKEILQN